MKFKEGEENEAIKLFNKLAREQLKLKIMQDIRVDLIVCEIEGWDKNEYISELKELLNELSKKN